MPAQPPVHTMSLTEKIGQLFTIGMTGTTMTPEIKTLIERYHIGGIRVTPNLVLTTTTYARAKEAKTDAIPPASPVVRPETYLELLNHLQELAAGRKNPMPLHISIDKEGGSAGDVSRGGYPDYPAPMGLALSDDPDVIYACHKQLAALLRASGINMIHSPVLDVATHPVSPEINTRSYHSDPEQVARLAEASLNAFSEEGIIATGKHFPGRGYSGRDVHFEADDCPLDFAEMEKGELLPYIRLIPKGLPAIMLAHSSYSGLVGDDVPATINEKIVTGILRNTLGYTGVITTDSITMRGLLDRMPVEEACAQAIRAGCDLVLYKTSEVEKIAAVIAHIEAQVRAGVIPERRIDESLERIFRMKKNIGLLDRGGASDPSRLTRLLAQARDRTLSRTAAENACVVLRNRKNLLPLTPPRKILVVEQSMFYARFTNDEYFHPYLLWEKLYRVFPEAGLHRLELTGTDEDIKTLQAVSVTYDLIVATNYYSRGSVPNTRFLEQLIHAVSCDVIVLNTNPFDNGLSDAMDTVACTFSDMPESLDVFIRLLTGSFTPKHTFPKT